MAFLRMLICVYSIHFTWLLRLGFVEMVKETLKEASIDVNMQDGSNRTPLPYAAKYGTTECVKLLLGVANIDVNIKDDSDCTPSELSRYSHHPVYQQTCSLPIERGAIEDSTS